MENDVLRILGNALNRGKGYGINQQHKKLCAAVLTMKEKRMMTAMINEEILGDKVNKRKGTGNKLNERK